MRVLCALLALLVLAACAQVELITSVPSLSTPTPGSSSPTASTPVVHQEASKVYYPTYADLAAHSDIIVIGQITGKDKIINGARNTQDLSQEDANIFGIGQVYRLAIDQFIKGNGPQEVFIIQSQGHISHPGRIVSQAEIEQVIQDNYRVVMVEEDTFLRTVYPDQPLEAVKAQIPGTPPATPLITSYPAPATPYPYPSIR